MKVTFQIVICKSGSEKYSRLQYTGPESGPLIIESVAQLPQVPMEVTITGFQLMYDPRGPVPSMWFPYDDVVVVRLTSITWGDVAAFISKGWKLIEKN